MLAFSILINLLDSSAIDLEQHFNGLHAGKEDQSCPKQLGVLNYKGFLLREIDLPSCLLIHAKLLADFACLFQIVMLSLS